VVKKKERPPWIAKWKIPLQIIIRPTRGLMVNKMPAMTTRTIMESTMRLEEPEAAVMEMVVFIAANADTRRGSQRLQR